MTLLFLCFFFFSSQKLFSLSSSKTFFPFLWVSVSLGGKSYNSLLPLPLLPSFSCFFRSHIHLFLRFYSHLLRPYFCLTTLLAFSPPLVVWLQPPSVVVNSRFAIFLWFLDLIFFKIRYVNFRKSHPQTLLYHDPRSLTASCH